MVAYLATLPFAKNAALASAGFLGFYDGLRAKIVQSVLAAALLMSIKEELTNAARVLLAGVPETAVVVEKVQNAAEAAQLAIAPEVK